MTYGEGNPRTGDQTAALNRFEDVEQGQITQYVSRADWEGTLPTARPEEKAAGAELAASLTDTPEYTVNESDEPITVADHGLTLEDMAGLDYDDPKWEQLLEQLSVEDMTNMISNGGWSTPAVNSVGKPATTELDGPAGINSLTSDLKGVRFPVRCENGFSQELDSATEEAAVALEKAIKTLRTAVDGFIEQDTSKTETVTKLNEEVDGTLAGIDSYLVQISAYDSTLETEKRIAALHSCLGDIHRVGELAQNVTKYTRRTEKDSLYFSPKVKDEVRDMFELLEKMSVKAGGIMTSGAVDELEEIDAMENEIDAKRKRLIKDHVARLGSGECRPESSGVFVNLVCNLERVGDHLNYIAHSSDQG